MKKRCLSLVLVVAMLFSLCGCNVSETSDAVGEVTESVEEISEEADKSSDSEEEAGTEKEEEKKESVSSNKEKSEDENALSGMELVEALTSAGSYPTEADYSELYESVDAAIADCKVLVDLGQELQDKYRGTLDNKESILGVLQDMAAENGPYYLMYRLNTYATLLVFKNLMDSDARRISNKFNQAITDFDNKTAFIDSEIYELPIETRQEIFDSPEFEFLGNYSSIYTDSERKTFDEPTSQIINTLTGNASDPMDTFSILYDETPLLSITFPDGQEKELTEEVVDEIIYGSGDYDHNFMIEVDDLIGRRFGKLINTYTSLLQTQMQNYVNRATVNGYDNYLEYAMKDDYLETEIYDKNIESVHNILPQYRRYVDLRKEAIGADDGITYAEMLGNVITSDKNIKYDDAVRTAEEALLVYGDDYVKTFDAMLRKAHVDADPTENKRVGAFSMAAYDPGIYAYINMNYRGSYYDMTTLVHEGGHAMYSNISSTPEDTSIFKRAEIGIFTHEIASTLNEYILTRHLIDTADNDEDKLFYLDSLLTMINQSVILQTKYSEFEKYCYEKVESGEGLDAEDISEYWYNLEKDYEGDSALMTDGRRYAWSRVPHFYYGYYVYKYSTSCTYSGIIANRIFSGDEEIVDDYLDMLALGASYKPSDLLRTINIDPTEDKVYLEFADLYKGLMDEYEELLISTGRIQR